MRHLAWLLLIPLLSPGCHECDCDNIDWFVDATFGSDSGGDGSPAFPYRTIHKALTRAQDGDNVFVAPGTYSTAIGESFPLEVGTNVHVEGDPGSKGNGSTPTFVTGGGSYTITAGTQASTVISAAFVLKSGATLSGFKVTSPGATGVGVEIDNASATLEFCTLTGCGGDGVRVNGPSAPAIRNSVVSSNANDGIATFDASAASIRSNSILSNSSDGVQANDTSVPNLGDAAGNGANVIQSNAAVGLNNSTTASTIQAVGNTWNVSVQGSSATGTYASGPPVTGPVAVTPGFNFAISPGGAIQF